MLPVNCNDSTKRTGNLPDGGLQHFHQFITPGLGDDEGRRDQDMIAVPSCPGAEPAPDDESLLETVLNHLLGDPRRPRKRPARYLVLDEFDTDSLYLYFLRYGNSSIDCSGFETIPSNNRWKFSVISAMVSASNRSALYCHHPRIHFP